MVIIIAKLYELVMLEKNKSKSKSHTINSKIDQTDVIKAGFFYGIAKKPGFLIAIIAVLVLLVILVFVQYDPTVSQEKIVYAQQFYTSNQTDLNTYLQSVIDEQANEQPTTLDESYLSSTKADIEWLIVKEQWIYTSRPSNEVYPKEAAFTLFAQKIISANTNYSISAYVDNYDATIEQGAALDFNVPELLTQDELNQTFTNDAEITVYKNTLNKLFFDYVNSKKQFIKNTTSKERQYVEAKKIILLSEQE